jgi:hypothetical protein
MTTFWFMNGARDFVTTPLQAGKELVPNTEQVIMRSTPKMCCWLRALDLLNMTSAERAKQVL